MDTRRSIKWIVEPEPASKAARKSQPKVTLRSDAYFDWRVSMRPRGEDFGRTMFWAVRSIGPERVSSDE